MDMKVLNILYKKLGILKHLLWMYQIPLEQSLNSLVQNQSWSKFRLPTVTFCEWVTKIGSQH